MTRRQFLRNSLFIGVATGLAGTALGQKFQSGKLEVTTKRLSTLGLKQPLRLLHLSDFHASPDVPFSLIEESIALGISRKPDLIAITGDWVTETLDDEETYRALLHPLSRTAPTFACFGNHDGGLMQPGGEGLQTALSRLLQSAGITLLLNRSIKISPRGQPITVAGLGDLWAGQARPAVCLKNRDQPAPHPTLLLSHNPDSKKLLRSYAWDLMLCGHTHGGQCVIPVLGWRPFLPIEDKRFAEGLLPWDGRHIHVTRGVGNLHGIRFNCPPEVSLLELS